MNIRQLLEKYDIDYPPGGTSISDGWVPTLETLFKKLIALGWDKKIAQIKTKFGELRIYAIGFDEKMRSLVLETESLLNKTCMICGSTGTIHGFSVLCSLCREKLAQ